MNCNVMYTFKLAPNLDAGISDGVSPILIRNGENQYPETKQGLGV